MARAAVVDDGWHGEAGSGGDGGGEEGGGDEGGGGEGEVRVAVVGRALWRGWR